MTQADHNLAPIAAPLRVGVIADADALPRLAAALARPTLSLAAQAGMRPSEALSGAQWYDDVRVLIAQGGVEALLLHTSPRGGADLASIALEHGIHVWRAAPLARRFNEGAEIVRLARESSVVYRVASWWDHISDDARWAESLGSGFRALLTVARVSAAGPSVQDWRSNAVDAGGGVLMTESYSVLEALLAARGLPQRVVATVGRCRRKPGAAPRETEDVVGAILNYEDGGVAIVESLWDVPPYAWSLAHHGAEATLEFSPTAVRLRHGDGRVIDERTLPATEDIIAREVTLFEQAIAATRVRPRAAAIAAASDPPEPPRTVAARATLDRHLALIALIETIYLAARTGQPERPAKLYEVQGWPEPAL